VRLGDRHPHRRGADRPGQDQGELLVDRPHRRHDSRTAVCRMAITDDVHAPCSIITPRRPAPWRRSLSAAVKVVGAPCHDPGVSIVRYRYRVYPTAGQAQMLARTFGCVRVVYNDSLRLRRDAHAAGEKLSDTEVQRRVITEAKRTPEREWLSEVLALRLVRDNQAIHLEDLSVAGLARTRLARSVHDVGWSTLVRLVADKAAQYGRTVVKIDRRFPSSQLCSMCGHRDGPKPLAVRAWTCPACGAEHDRDLNAACNVLAEGRRIAAGLAEIENACGADVRPGRVPAVGDETGTRLARLA